jgi:hypothetical protein
VVNQPVYYRRSITGRDAVSAWLVYALFVDAPAPSPDVVAGVGAFPHGYRPTERAGEVMADAKETRRFWTCDVPRAQLRHYLPLTEREAFTYYPRLQHFVALAERALQETGDLPLAGATG